jgi:hypothetical protein
MVDQDGALLCCWNGGRKSEGTIPNRRAQGTSFMRSEVSNVGEETDGSWPGIAQSDAVAQAAELLGKGGKSSHTVFFFAKSPDAPSTTITVLSFSSSVLCTSNEQ